MFDLKIINKFFRSNERPNGFKDTVREFAKDESAATSIEYALIAIIVGVGIIGSLSAITPELVAVFNYLATSFQTILA